MKKIIITFMISCILVLISGCIFGKNASDGKQLQEMDTAQTTENNDIKETHYELSLQSYQDNAIMFFDSAYLSLNEAIYKVDSNGHIEIIQSCTDAVGMLRNDYLYWALWEADGPIRIIKIDQNHQIFEVGELETNTPISSLDFYEDILFIRYKLGNVEGYRLNQNGEITEAASVEEMQIYENENQAAKMRAENPDDRSSIQKYPYHIIGAGYSKEICGKEFLAKHIQNGETGHEELIERQNGQDTILLTYYENAIISGKKIIYFDSVEKNSLAIYDMDNTESQSLYKFHDGNFELTIVENNTVYGIWNSIQQSKSYFVGISIDTLKMTPYFEVSKDMEYLVLNNIIYYVNPSSGELVFYSLEQFSEDNMTKEVSCLFICL